MKFILLYTLALLSMTTSFSLSCLNEKAGTDLNNNKEIPIGFPSIASHFGLVRDSSTVYMGDPILYSYSNAISNEEYRIYYGTQDPITDWKFTFDFDETSKTLSEQVKIYKENNFLKQGDIKVGPCPGRYVMYADPKSKIWESHPNVTIIEAKLTCSNRELINIDYKNFTSEDTAEIFIRFLEITQSLKIPNGEFR